MVNGGGPMISPGYTNVWRSSGSRASLFLRWTLVFGWRIVADRQLVADPLRVSMAGSLSEGFTLQLISPIITATVGTLIIGSLAAWITRRAQDRRVNNQLRHQLVTQMTEAASTFHFEAQRYRRASRAIGNEGVNGSLINTSRLALREKSWKVDWLGTLRRIVPGFSGTEPWICAQLGILPS
jgi:hypothetical protein